MLANHKWFTNLFPHSDCPSIHRFFKIYKNLFYFFPQSVYHRGIISKYRSYPDHCILQNLLIPEHDGFRILQHTSIMQVSCLVSIFLTHCLLHKSWLVTATLVLDLCCTRLRITPTAYKNTLGNLLCCKPTSTDLWIKFY